jgi:hypothetical protein
MQFLTKNYYTNFYHNDNRSDETYLIILCQIYANDNNITIMNNQMKKIDNNNNKNNNKKRRIYFRNEE